MTDIVAQMYSGPLVSRAMGYRQLGGGPFQTVQKFAIPILQSIRQSLASAARGVAEAVRDAGSTAIKQAVKSLPDAAASGVKKVIEFGTEKLVEKMIKRPPPIATEALSPPSKFTAPLPARKRTVAPKKHKSPKRRRRSRVDDLLGDNSY